ncbi:MAG: 2-amino-4-hydroxy-6-hydroxymethyldihydropteridine diphosphokinase [Magnetococcales bacterium]|nr:2-amino-4-hydroxy-6-hydroxymethyldihydropteridine diphosphokinase [Magnetococcales bacterium]
MSEPILIAFGANIDPLANLIAGLTQLHQEMPLEAISTVYRTTPLRRTPTDRQEPDFLNGAVLTRHPQEPDALKKRLRRIEASRMRKRQTGDPDAPRTLDLDLALMGNRVMRPPASMTLPDPDILKRPFVAIPLAELAPKMIHPDEGTTLAVIAARFQPNPVEMAPDRKATQALRAILR